MNGSLIETTDYMTIQVKQLIKDDDMENKDMMKIHFLINSKSVCCFFHRIQSMHIISLPHDRYPWNKCPEK